MGKTEDEVEAFRERLAELRRKLTMVTAIAEAGSRTSAQIDRINATIRRYNFRGRFVHTHKGKSRRRHPIKQTRQIPAWLGFAV